MSALRAHNEPQRVAIRAIKSPRCISHDFGLIKSKCTPAITTLLFYFVHATF